MRNVWNTAINIGTFTLKNTETNQVLALDSVVLDSGERVIVAFGNGSLAAEAQFILANNYPDQNLSEDGLHWQWQTDLILGDDAARLQLFENNIQRDELRYGDDIGKLAENDSSQDSVYVLHRQGYEVGGNTSDYPEYGSQAKKWEETDEVAIIYGGYVLRPVNLKRYELKDHLGNVRVIVSDVKDATLGTHGGATAFAAIIEHYSHYYPFGMEKPSMVWDKGGYRYGFNGQEQVNEISGAANHNTALFWEFDVRTARRWNLDPKPNASISEYATFSGNPIMFSDVLGDSIIVDEIGYIVRIDFTDDRDIYRQTISAQGTFHKIPIGKLGETIQSDVIYSGLLDKHIDEAHWINPFTFKNYVRNKGEWDLKKNTKTIYGYARQYDKDKGDEKRTRFEFQGKNYIPEELGNHHYGATGKAVMFFGIPETVLLQQAGEAQIAAGTSKPEWQPTEITTDFCTRGEPNSSVTKLPPYGDDPQDQELIKEGFEYYDKH